MKIRVSRPGLLASRYGCKQQLTAVGRDLYYIHTTGDVPECEYLCYLGAELADKEKLDLPMTRYHQKLRPETPGWRNSTYHVTLTTLFSIRS